MDEIVPIARYRVPNPREHGVTTHRNGIDGTEWIHTLLVGKYDDSPGVYIFYFDAEGRELNDRFYDIVEQVQNHLKKEFEELELRE